MNWFMSGEDMLTIPRCSLGRCGFGVSIPRPGLPPLHAKPFFLFPLGVSCFALVWHFSGRVRGVVLGRLGNGLVVPFYFLTDENPRHE